MPDVEQQDANVKTTVGKRVDGNFELLSKQLRRRKLS